MYVATALTILVAATAIQADVSLKDWYKRPLPDVKKAYALFQGLDGKDKMTIKEANYALVIAFNLREASELEYQAAESDTDTDEVLDEKEFGVLVNHILYHPISVKREAEIKAAFDKHQSTDGKSGMDMQEANDALVVDLSLREAAIEDFNEADSDDNKALNFEEFQKLVVIIESSSALDIDEIKKAYNIHQHQDGKAKLSEREADDALVIELNLRPATSEEFKAADGNNDQSLEDKEFVTLARYIEVKRRKQPAEQAAIDKAYNELNKQDGEDEMQLGEANKALISKLGLRAATKEEYEKAEKEGKKTKNNKEFTELVRIVETDPIVIAIRYTEFNKIFKTPNDKFALAEAQTHLKTLGLDGTLLTDEVYKKFEDPKDKDDKLDKYEFGRILFELYGAFIDFPPQK